MGNGGIAPGILMSVLMVVSLGTGVKSSGLLRMLRGSHSSHELVNF